MLSRHALLGLLFLFHAVSFVGCGTGEPTVIEPETYELTEQEQVNLDRAQEILARQRQ